MPNLTAVPDSIEVDDDDRFQVIISYCNDVQFQHPHNTIEFAAKEYSTMLMTALLDEGEPALPRHVRAVHMLVFNKGGTLRSHIDTGVFSCSHRR